MTSIQDPFLVQIDSFALNDISRDYFHEDSAKKQKAYNFIDEFYKRGAIPIITWHHIEEMLSHKNDEVSAKSIAFILALPLIAVLKSDIESFIGSIYDIDKKEIQTIIMCEDEIEIGLIIQETCRNIYKFCSGASIIEPLIPNMGIIRQTVLSKAPKKKEMASISRAKSLNPHYKHKLSDIKNMKNYTYSEEATNTILNNMKSKLTKEIKEQGDKKISSDSAEKIATGFIADIKIDSTKVDVPMIEMIRKSSGLSKEEFEKVKSWEDLECVPIFKGRLGSIAKEFPESQKEKIINLKEEYCPTWLLWKEIYKIRVKAERASGSDINDAFLAGLSLYAGLTIVDKRTHEYLTQIKRKDVAISEFIQRFEKLSCYLDILNYLPSK